MTRVVEVLRVAFQFLAALSFFDLGSKRSENKELKHDAKIDNAYNRGVNNGRVRRSKGNLGVREVNK